MRDKVLGVLVWPLGLAGVGFLLAFPAGLETGCSSVNGGPQDCTTQGFSLPLPVRLLVLALLIVGPLLTAWHLLRVRDGD